LPSGPRPAGSPRLPERLVQLVWLLDDAFRIPGTQRRIGLDALLGLLPGGGDVVGAAVSGWIVVESARLGASPRVLARMLGNVALDALVGVVPLLGDLFDFGWKANRRNLTLLERHLTDPHALRRSSRLLVAGWAAAAGALVVLLAVAAISVGTLIGQVI
jgi:hypothetical protein